MDEQQPSTDGAVKNTNEAANPASVSGKNNENQKSNDDWHAIEAIMRDHAQYEDARADLVHYLETALNTRRVEIANEIKSAPESAGKMRFEYAAITDRIVKLVYRIATEIANKPISAATTAERMSVLAVGGYGRGEMAPHSDVDLLFLIPYKQNAWTENVIETSLYLLWDLKFKIGQAVRTTEECVALAREDLTIRTSLLENRYLAGEQSLVEALNLSMRSELFENTVREFIEGKLDERENRHNKSGNTRYVLEPNVKEAKGGLRDLQTLYWLGKYMTGAETTHDLVEAGMFQDDEYNVFTEAEDFLWTVRVHLHLATKRPNDLLSFDWQVDVAKRMGFEDQPERRGVEIFMQAYFRAARQVGELTRVFLTELEARHLKKPSIFQRIGNMVTRDPLPNAFKLEFSRINFSSERALTQDPLNMLRIFMHALSHDTLIHPQAFRWIARHHELIDDKFRTSRAANHLFLKLLLDYGNPERALRRMNELGVLGLFIPEWARIDAMMQYNMYHSYTVDEHTIQCLSILSEIEKEHLVEEVPIASAIMKEGVNRKVLYVALLLHDIGKGQSRPHEDIGAEIALKLGPRLGLDKYETELASWLVQHHLDMSDFAQKRDLSDPKTLHNFAELVQDQEKLDLLTVLTVCDIRGVGPHTWNNWKAMLLRELYRSTRSYFEEGGVISAQGVREKSAKADLRARLTDWDDADISREQDRHNADYWIGLSTDIHVEFAKLLKELGGDEMRMTFAADEDRDATRITFAMPDHPGLFARLCGALSLSSANIVDARTYTSSDGFATPVFWVQNDQGMPYPPARYKRLEKQVDKTLKGEVITRRALAEREKIKKREREFRVPTKITFDNEGSRIYTLIEIDTRDRKGLLYDLSRTLTNMNIQISSAIIATYGEQAVDTFYVKDIFGLKVNAKSKQDAIKAQLLEAITQGNKEALAD